MGQLNPATLQQGDRVGLDTVTLIYFLERHPVHYPTVKQLFRQIETGWLSGVMASLVFTELLVPAYRCGELATVERLERTLCNFPHLDILPLTSHIARDAARLRARSGLRTPDAIHAATALAGAVDCFVSNNRGLLRLEPELKVWLLE